MANTTHHPKMDPKLLSDQLHELDDFRKKMKKEGIKTSRKELRLLNEQYNNSSEKIAEHLRAKQPVIPSAEPEDIEGEEGG